MTNKQRAKIYREAAEMIADEHFLYCCQAIAEVYCNNCRHWFHINSKNFPEFFMFQFEKDGGSAWWSSYTCALEKVSTKEPRILALLLSEQMALNP